MTDISQWPELVQVVRLRQRKPLRDEGWQNWVDGSPVFSDYVTLPFNSYTLGNLLGMLARTCDNGDWYDELISMCCAAMDKAGIAEVTNNWGDTIRLEDAISRSFISTIRASENDE